MLTKQQRDEIQKRYKALGTGQPQHPMTQARQDIFALLDELYEVEALGSMLHYDCGQFKTQAEQAEADRDLWKSRAEALEQAAYGLCEYCINYGESTSDDNSPCFEYGAYMNTQRNGYFPACEHWSFKEELEK